MTAAVSSTPRINSSLSINTSEEVLAAEDESLLLTHQFTPPPCPPLPNSLRGYALNPQFLKAYRPLKEIGSGGFGFVCTTLRLNDGQLLATKFIDKSKAISGFAHDDQLGRVPLEVYILKNVRVFF